MATSIRDIVNEANSTVEVIDAEAAADLVDTDQAIFVDVREPVEVAREGKVPHAIHLPRGLLEFAIAADSPAHNPQLLMDKKIVFYCASGGRSALAAATAKRMGVVQAINMAGGFEAYKAIGGDIEDV
ncbi:rhodanese-like domain-containing protein [Marivibrio halodurans]|uniref:Rhodanese-like domain-containing protein n=1 Tax=Marivibrio halodurans TaxID=2039722 RepID=A0A8J7V3K9_9PROT|nr:rhodanese-like domain-containing protein [Marivibrio halodurans]MBP5858480.1 rhodanese-like domain-containing protein [Marivibrio halodurans]